MHEYPRYSVEHPAPTYQEQHWRTLDWVTRCGECHKIVYPNQTVATMRAEQISSAREPMYAYQGRTCGHWHITRQPQPERMTAAEQRTAALQAQVMDYLTAHPQAKFHEVLRACERPEYLPQYAKYVVAVSTAIDLYTQGKEPVP